MRDYGEPCVSTPPLVFGYFAPLTRTPHNSEILRSPD